MSNEAIKIPDLGGADELEVIEIPVSAGDQVEVDDILLVLESDKASMEIPSPYTGTLAAIDVSVGDRISEGAVFAHIETGQLPGSVAQSPSLEPLAQSAPLKSEPPTLQADEQPAVEDLATATVEVLDVLVPAAGPVTQTALAGTVHAGPAVRKLAREFGIDLASVKASGPSGRILKEDVQAHVKARMQSAEPSSAMAISALPEVDFASFGSVRVEPMSSVQKLTAANMHRSWLNIPRVSQFDEIDITALEKFRSAMKPELEQQGLKLTPLPFLLKACARALVKNPIFNASLHPDGEHLVYKDYVNIGIAVDTAAGLMVPVIRDVDNKSLLQLATESAELAARAKARKLKRNEMQGGCLTISSLGSIGGTGFTPIINAPELAILGVSRLSVKPVWNGKKFKPRKMLPLTLAYDHRAINGANAGRFMSDLGAMLVDVRRLLL